MAAYVVRHCGLVRINICPVRGMKKCRECGDVKKSVCQKQACTALSPVQFETARETGQSVREV
eukprot:1679907-Pyramimonas_sp.AAC.1